MVYFINYFIFATYLRTGPAVKPKTMEITSANTNKRRLFARRFSRRVTTCFAVCGFLAFVNWYTSPHYWWVVWVIAGWGLSILLSLIRYLFDQDDEDDCRNR